jgi:hypothetical protein
VPTPSQSIVLKSDQTSQTFLLCYSISSILLSCFSDPRSPCDSRLGRTKTLWDEKSPSLSFIKQINISPTTTCSEAGHVHVLTPSALQTETAFLSPSSTSQWITSSSLLFVHTFLLLLLYREKGNSPCLSICTSVWQSMDASMKSGTRSNSD